MFRVYFDTGSATLDARARDTLSRVVAKATPAALPGVESATPGAVLANGWQEWDVRLKPGVAPGDLLETCTGDGVPLRRFEERRASLHDVFLHMVGPAETEA
jgi:ABC-2 type transport system ATP-binding protein